MKFNELGNSMQFKQRYVQVKVSSLIESIVSDSVGKMFATYSSESLSSRHPVLYLC